MKHFRIQGLDPHHLLTHVYEEPFDSESPDSLIGLSDFGPGYGLNLLSSSNKIPQ
jgi:hypothetical protein